MSKFKYRELSLPFPPMAQGGWQMNPQLNSMYEKLNSDITITGACQPKWEWCNVATLISKRKKNTPRKRGAFRIEQYGPQSLKSIVKPGMAHTGLVLERSTRNTKETESSKPNWNMKQDGLKILSNRLVIWLSVCTYLSPSLT